MNVKSTRTKANSAKQNESKLPTWADFSKLAEKEGVNKKVNTPIAYTVYHKYGKSC